MLNPETNSNRRQSSTFMETLQDKLKDIKNFSNWSAKEQMVAVTAVGVIFGALLPVVAVALPVAAAGAAVALTLFFAVKAVEYGYKGFKWSAEKTVEGAKYTAGKIKAGAVHVKNSVKEAVSSTKQATRERAGSALRTMGNSVQEFGRKISNSGASMSSLDSIPYSIEPHGQTVVLKTEEKTKNFNSVKEMFIKEVFEDKAVSSALTKEIFSELKGKILEKANSVDGQQDFKKDQLINQLRQQADFVSKLNAKNLQKLLTQDDNNLYEIFSEHHSEIKGIIKDESTRFKAIDNLNKAAEAYLRMNGPGSTPPSLSRSGSTDSLNSASSTVGLLTGEHKEVKTTSSLKSKVSSLFRGNKAPKKAQETTGVGYQVLPEDTKPPATVNHNNLSRSPSSSSLYDGSPVPTPEAPASPTTSGYGSGSSGSSVPPKPLAVNLAEVNERKEQQTLSTSRSNSPDSGINSGPSTPTGRQSPAHMMLTEKGGSMKKQAHLKKTGRLDELVGQPSTEIDVDTDVQHQTAPNFVA